MEVLGSCSLISPTKAYGGLEGAGSLCPHSPKILARSGCVLEGVWLKSLNPQGS